MAQLPQADLWSTFSPQTQRHLVNVWTELLGRYLHAQHQHHRCRQDCGTLDLFRSWTTLS